MNIFGNDGEENTGMPQEGGAPEMPAEGAPEEGAAPAEETPSEGGM